MTSMKRGGRGVQKVWRIKDSQPMSYSLMKIIVKDLSYGDIDTISTTKKNLSALVKNDLMWHVFLDRDDPKYKRESSTWREDYVKCVEKANRDYLEDMVTFFSKYQTHPITGEFYSMVHLHEAEAALIKGIDYLKSRLIEEIPRDFVTTLDEKIQKNISKIYNHPSNTKTYREVIIEEVLRYAVDLADYFQREIRNDHSSIVISVKPEFLSVVFGRLFGC